MHDVKSLDDQKEEFTAVFVLKFWWLHKRHKSIDAIVTLKNSSHEELTGTISRIYENGAMDFKENGKDKRILAKDEYDSWRFQNDDWQNWREQPGPLQGAVESQLAGREGQLCFASHSRSSWSCAAFRWIGSSAGMAEGVLKFPRCAPGSEEVKKVNEVLEKVRDCKLPSRREAKLLPIVIFSDFELDDLMAIAQIWQWTALRLNAPESARPVIVFSCDFATKDGGGVFEKKMLLARLMLGITLRDCYVVTCEPGEDQKNWRYYDGQVHPMAEQIFQNTERALQQAAQEIVTLAEQPIDFYVIAPGRDRFGDLIEQVAADAAFEKIASKTRVVMYTGSFNTLATTEKDYQHIRKLCQVNPLVDISKFIFFGKAEAHPVTASIDTFSSPSLAPELSKQSPLLTQAIVTFVDEFQGNLVSPSNKSLFRGSTLTPEEEERFKKISELSSDMQKYAEALWKDKELFQKVPGYKQTTVTAFANGTCDAPLCDQVCFLYEWCHNTELHELDLMEIHWPRDMDLEWKDLEREEGSWWLNKTRGFTGVSTGEPPDGCAFQNIKAIQPQMKNPKDLELLEKMRKVLEQLVLRHLARVGPVNSAEDVIGIEG